MTAISGMTRMPGDDKDASDIKSSVLENPQLHLVSQH